MIVSAACGSGTVIVTLRPVRNVSLAMAWMARMYQQQYQLMMKQRQAEAQAFMATFDTNHNGTIEGKERGPAEHYLRERRLGKIPPLTLASTTRNKK